MENSQMTEATAAPQQILNNQEQFFLKFRKQILVAVAAVVIVIAGFAAYNTFIAGPREDKASTALAKAQDLFAQGQYKEALNGTKGMEGFLAISENNGGTDAANLASLYAGLCYAQLGDWANAVKYLDDFSTQGDALISPAATAALGNAYANTGDIDKAISTLKKAADMADSEAADGVNNSIAPTFRIQAARLLESQGKKADALAIYKEVKEKYVNSAASQDIDKYIERVSE